MHCRCNWVFLQHNIFYGKSDSEGNFWYLIKMNSGSWYIIIFSSDVEMCFLRLILQKNGADKYRESNSCTTNPTLEQFLDTLKVHSLNLHPSQKQKVMDNKCLSWILCSLHLKSALNIFREWWAWRSDWKRLSDSGWEGAGDWWFSKMGASSRFFHFLPLLLNFLLVAGESQDKNRGQIFLDCLHGEISWLFQCRVGHKLFVALNWPAVLVS